MTTKKRLFRTFLLVPILFVGLMVFGQEAQAFDFVVNSAADPGDGTCTSGNCTLREAITAAESTSYSGDDTISFAIGTGNVTINIGSALPTLGTSNGSLEIDGTTQPGGYVIIDGTSMSGCCYPIDIQSSDNIIKGLVIVDAPYSGIGITANGITASNNKILGNYIGYNPVTSSASANQSGIFIQAINNGTADNNMIGDGTTSGRNIISGNTTNGIQINGDASTVGGLTNTKIWGNYIGLAPDGSTMVANGDDGVSVNGGNISGLQIGGPSCETRWSDCDGNVISGNTRNGIWFFNTATGDNAMSDYLIQNNYIGTDSTGELDKGNTSNGIQFTGDISNITILDNLISGNGTNGIYFGYDSTNPTHPDPRGILVASNTIGTDDDGTTAIANGSDGIELNTLTLTSGGTTLVEIGSPGYDANLISGNANYGVNVTSCSFDEGELIISQNVIGLNSSGDAAIGNGYSGIYTTDSTYVQIGRSLAGGYNIISGNGTDGAVYGSGIEMVDTSYVKIRGNAIGTDANAEARIYNELYGITISDSSGSPTDYEIGSPDSAYYGNVISGSGYNQTACDGDCHALTISNTSNVEVYNNIIGLDINETSVLANYGSGIVLDTVSGITIGSESAPNRIGGNDGTGIDVTSASGTVKIVGNTVGLGASLDNGGAGVSLMWAVDPDNLISENTIEYSGEHGIFMFGSTAQIENNTISSNSAQGIAAISSELYTAADSDNPVSFSTGPMIYGNDIQSNAAEGIYLIDYEPSNLSTSSNTNLIWDDNNGTEGNSTSSSLTNNNSNGDQVEVMYFGAVEILDADGNTVTSLGTGSVTLTDNQSSGNEPTIDTYVSAGGGLGIWGSDNFFGLGSFAWTLDYDTNWGYFSWPLFTSYTLSTSGALTDYNPYTISVVGASAETGSATFSWDGDDSTHPIAPDFDTRPGNIDFSNYKRYQVAQVMYDETDLSSPDLATDPDSQAVIDNVGSLPIVTPDDGSSSTSPTDEGDDVTFTITAKDWNNDTYYFAVCKTDAITHNGTSAPSCPGGEWTIGTSAVASESEATVTYTTTGSETCDESCAWYAFACEAVTGGECMPPTGYGAYVGQGSAVGYLEFSGRPEDGDQVTLDGDVYEFDHTDGATCSGGEDYCVDISSAEDAYRSAEALAGEYNGTSSIATNISNRLYIYATTAGSTGNSIGITESDVNEGGSSNEITFSGTTLDNGNSGSVTDAQASPFKINHRPVIGTVAIGDTTGGTGTIEAGDDVYFNVAVTDGDTDDTADTIDMHVCLTNSFTEGSGCDANQTICKTTGNSSGSNAECNSGDASGNLTGTYNDTGTSSGQKTVYIFLEDSHDLQDAGTDNDQNYTLANSTPSFTAGPTDSGSSTTSLTTAGNDVTFTATATDGNGDSYYLLVCNNNSAPTVGTPPECNGGSGNRWALSSATTSGNPVSGVTYTTSSSDSESNTWYAFVCDATSCSSSAQGTGDNGSPFVINHAPTFTAVAISDNTTTSDEVLVDGDMETAGVTNWNTGGGSATSTLTKETTSPHGGSQLIRVANQSGSTANVWTRQSVFTDGVTYRMTGWARSDGTHTPRIYQTSETSNIWSGTTSTSWQSFDVTFTAGQTGYEILFGGTAIGDTGYTEWDDLSIFNIGTIEPGDTLRFTLLQEQMIETDTEGGQDTIDFYVCSSATSGYSSGCTGGSLICSDTAVNPSTTDATCDEAANNLVPIPTAHGTANVKVYIEDSEGLAGTGTAQQDYTIEDVAPTITSYGMTDTLVPVAGTYDTYEYTAVISDNNGESDVVGVEGWFYDDTAIDLTSGQCTEDENDCYKDSDGCALNTSYGTNVEVEATCSMNIWFNANASTGWAAHVNPEDETTTVTDGSDSGAQENPELQGITVSNVSSIAYGTVALGEISARKETAMGNVGNQIIDVYLTGTDMTCSAGSCGSETIGKAQQKWYHSDTDFNWNAAATDPGPYILLGSTGGTTGAGGCANRNIPVRDAHASTSGDESVWWKLKIPDTQASGEYAGTNTFTTTGSTTCTGTQY